MVTINLGPLGRFKLIRERALDPPRAPSPEFIPTQHVDKVRIDKSDAPPSYSLVRELDIIRDTPPPRSFDSDGLDSHPRSMMLRPRSPGRLPVPEYHYTGSSSSESPARMPKSRSPAALLNPSCTYAGSSSTSRSRPDPLPLTPWMRSTPNEHRTNLQRWLIEVVALMLGANFDSLNAALCPDESNFWG
jgi:hypothetical protein